MNDFEQRAPDAEELLPKARVIPFEKPQTVLQRAVQARAQEQIERLQYKPKIPPLRLFVTFCVALLPVLVLLGAADVAVRGIHLLITLQAAKRGVEQSAPAPQLAPTPIEAQPGVVLLVPSQPQSPDSSD
jgi:hypothetical protein